MNRKDEPDPKVELAKGKRGRTTKGGATADDARKIARDLEKSAKKGWPFGRKGGGK